MKQATLWGIRLFLTTASLPWVALAQEATPASADTTLASLDATLPTEERLNSLRAAMEENPYNLDPYFEYAQISFKNGDFAESAKAYEHMLAISPELDRVKLELSLAYAQSGRYDEAKALLEDLKQRDIPPRVRQNIDVLLGRIEQATKQHFFSGAITAGLNFDSNGNSAPTSDQVLVFDTLLNLSPDSQARSDRQAFASATLNHQYRARPDSALQWRSSATYYQTKQDRFDDLDLNLYVVQSGPVYRFNEGKTQADITAGYTYIFLNDVTYLRQPSLEAGLEQVITPKLRLRGSARSEYRSYQNAPNITTIEDRRGHATQGRLAAYYSLTDQALLDAQLTIRHEDARADQYTNLQFQPQIGLTYQWDNGVFARGQVGYRNINYQSADRFISQRERFDREKSLGLTLGKTLAENITLTVGYDYRDVDSNLTNYDYDNHRFSTVVGWQF